MKDYFKWSWKNDPVVAIAEGLTLLLGVGSLLLIAVMLILDRYARYLGDI